MNPSKTIPRLVVAGTASGVGKTTLVAGLITALRARGLVVQPFKCGPDYIDPSYHTRAAGRPCRNLDSWMLDDAQVSAAFSRACEGADIAIIEGVMGLFDGSRFDDERASAAQIAKLLGAPVLLVMDISGAARSAAAMALGFTRFDPAVRVGGVALNLAGSTGHAAGCRDAIEQSGGPPVLGWLPRDPTLSVPERHLGLVQAGEHSGGDALLARIGAAVTERFDLDALVALARSAPALAPTATQPSAINVTDRSPLLAVARDDAFSFYYPENLDLLAAAGARIAFFRPTKGEAPPEEAAGVYLGGGYPELHAAALSANTPLRVRLRELHARGAPILAECGGFMVLTEALIDGDGRRWPMAGLVPGVVRMQSSLAALGYRIARADHANLLGEVGDELRGHEFHYSTWETPDGIGDGHHAWRIRGLRTEGEETAIGFAHGNLLASYLHIHLGQRADLAARLVARLRPPTEGQA